MENQKLRSAILEVVKTQLRDNEPPETRKTFERLLHEGFSEKETLKLLGYVVASEVFGVLKKGVRYDEKRYVSALNALPKLPWAQE